jgi:hypothetical protein
MDSENTLNITEILNTLYLKGLPIINSVIHFYKSSHNIFMKCGRYPFTHPVY